MSSSGTSMRWGWATLLALAVLTCLAFPAIASAGSIAGTARDAVGSFGIEEVEVCAEGEEDFGCAVTDTDGDYEILNLEAGEYIVEFWDPLAEYATQFFDRKRFYWEADLVLVGAGATTGIGATLERAGSLQGTVRNAANGAGLEEVEVCAWEVATEGGRCTYTDPAGNYALRRLAAGNYKVEFWPYEPFDIQYWNNKASYSEADVIAVSPGSTFTAINANLLGGPLPPPPVVTPPPTITPPAVKPKPKRCKKGFRKKKVRGKVRCVKVRKQRKKNRGQKSRASALAARSAS